MKVTKHSGDISDLMPIIRALHDECDTASFGMGKDPARFAESLQKIADTPGCILLVLGDSPPVGFMGVVTFKSPVGHEWIANEHFWYVLPDHRGVKSMRLIKAAREWAKEQGCSHFMCNASLMASPLHDRTCELYEAMGGKKFETTYLMEV